MRQQLKIIAYRLSRSDILFWTLPLLMVLLVVGTIAQKEVGIYAAQKAYFSSLITFIGPVPFPGGGFLMSVLFINMLMKFLLFSEWQWNKSGIILTHFGILVLLLGGLVTALTTRESYLIVQEGQSSGKLEDYYQRQLTVEKDGIPVFHLPHEKLADAKEISDPSFPFRLKIDTYCFNCAIEKRPVDDKPWQGPGRFMRLVPEKKLPKNEENLTGIEFTISGTNADGAYVTFDKFPKPPEFEIGGHIYKILIDRKSRVLPFKLKLVEFSQDFYPGSDTAKAYRSDVVIIDGQDTWPVRIEMNRPLRFKGYTIYQSSFDISDGAAFTVLNVVENSGRLFPYISSLIIAAGLIIHLVLRMRRS